MSEVRIDSFLIVLFFMYIGVIRHYFNVKKTKRTSVNLFTYLIKGSRNGVMAKHSAIFGAAIGVCMAGIGDWVNPQLLWATFIENHLLNLKAMVMAGIFITAGYTADSEINNTEKK